MNFERTLSFRADAEAEYYLKELSKETGLNQSKILRLGLAELMKKSKKKELIDYGRFLETDMLRSRNRRIIRGLTYLKNVSGMLKRLKEQGFSENQLMLLKNDLLDEARAFNKEQEFLEIFKDEIENVSKLKTYGLK